MLVIDSFPLIFLLTSTPEVLCIIFRRFTSGPASWTAPHHHHTPTCLFIVIISWCVDCPHCLCLIPSQMAQRLLLRRFLTSIISRKPSQSRWAPLVSRALQTPQYSPGYLAGTPSQARSIYTTRVCSTTFNIQDGPDFQDRVVNSETPVVVDFHAQWVLGVRGRLGYHLFRYLFIERLLCLSTPFNTSHTWTRGHRVRYN